MESLIIKGAPGSPYTRKMLSILRYRRIPYKFIIGGLFEIGIMNTSHLPKAKVNLMPTFYFENKDKKLEPMVDSTFIIRRLENLYLARSVIPSNPVLKFLDYLLEDYADEWLTKATFHYRWTYNEDIRKAGNTLSRWSSLTDNEDQIKSIRDDISQRQISRLHVVGSNKITSNIIEKSYKNILNLLNINMNNYPYTFGHKPIASDFALFGQLTQLAAFDPTPTKIADNIASRIVAWVGVMEDLSGLETNNLELVDSHNLTESLRNIFKEIGRTYIPVLIANQRAVNNNNEEVETEIDGSLWSQKPFPYQAKCLQWLKDEYHLLSIKDKKLTENFLNGTGCEVLCNEK